VDRFFDWHERHAFDLSGDVLEDVVRLNGADKDLEKTIVSLNMIYKDFNKCLGEYFRLIGKFSIARERIITAKESVILKSVDSCVSIAHDFLNRDYPVLKEVELGLENDRMCASFSGVNLRINVPLNGGYISEAFSDQSISIGIMENRLGVPFGSMTEKILKVMILAMKMGMLMIILLIIETMIMRRILCIR